MIKRVLDFFFALIALIFLFPFLILVAIAIKINSPGPILYRGVRTGINGKSFKILKFRTMVKDAERKGGPSTALNDPRLTKLGKFLRKYKIDEMPQLINILLGQMSFVGPRPQVEKYTSQYKGEEKIILSVKPGLTDYASIKFINLDKILGNKNVDEKYQKEIEPEKNRLRIKYVIEKSLWTDFKIIFQTFVSLFKINSLWNTKK